MRKVLAKVIVTPKPVVNDPQGLTVKQGLVTLGFREVEDVRVGKYIEVSLEAENVPAARERVEAMCRQLLANHVIEDFHFEIDHYPTKSGDFAGTPDKEDHHR